MKSSHNAKINYILSQAFQGFVDLLCKCQVMQHLFVLFHSHLEKKKQDGFFFFIKSTQHLHLWDHIFVASSFITRSYHLIPIQCLTLAQPLLVVFQFQLWVHKTHHTIQVPPPVHLFYTYYSLYPVTTLPFFSPSCGLCVWGRLDHPLCSFHSRGRLWRPPGWAGHLVNPPSGYQLSQSPPVFPPLPLSAQVEEWRPGWEKETAAPCWAPHWKKRDTVCTIWAPLVSVARSCNRGEMLLVPSRAFQQRWRWTQPSLDSRQPRDTAFI